MNTRLLHISDIHLLESRHGEILGIDTDRAFEKVMSHAMASDTKADAIIVTGDLSEDGSSASYLRLKAAFEQHNLPVFVLPGNHDVTGNMKEFLLNISITMNFHSQLGDWHLFCLNSQVIGKDYGLIGAEDLLKLGHALSTVGDAPCLVALHHNPKTNCTSEGCQLTNSHEFMTLLEHSPNVKAVLSGHTHCGQTETLADITLITAPSTFLQVDHNPTMNQPQSADFATSHAFHKSKGGYTVIDLFADGSLTNEVYWVPL